MTVRFNDKEQDMDTIFKHVEETKPQFPLIHMYAKELKNKDSNKTSFYAQKVASLFKWQKSHRR